MICPTCGGNLETCGHLAQPWDERQIAAAHRRLQLEKGDQADAWWRQVEARALEDPFLHKLVTLVQTGERTREEALIMVVLELAEVRDVLTAAEVERLSNAPPRPVSVGRDPVVLTSGPAQSAPDAALALAHLDLDALFDGSYDGIEEDKARPILERLWRTRGQADKQAVADTLRTLMGAAAAGPYLTHLERAIDALDKP